MEVSVLVTVKNDLSNVKVLVSSLRFLDKEFEIVVVDAYSTDGTYEYLLSKKEETSIVLARKRGNRSVGRNECIRLASGKKLVFLDSDSEVTENWGLILKGNINRDIVAGKIVQKPESRWSDLGRVPILFNGKDVTYPSNNLMYSADTIEKVGLFDERFNTAEDVDLNIRAIKSGFEIFYDDDLVIFHHPRETLISLLQQSYHDGAGRRLIMKKHGLGSSFNASNLRNHPILESSRLVSGMLGYVFGD